jgi:hypothetical protein
MFTLQIVANVVNEPLTTVHSALKPLRFLKEAVDHEAEMELIFPVLISV